MRDLEIVTRELADVQDALLRLADDDFGERFRLQTLQDRLRAEAARLREEISIDPSRSDEALLAELAARRAQLHTLEKQQINMATQSLAGAGGATFSADEWGIAHTLTDSLGIPQVQTAIAALKQVLDERGVEYPAT